LFDTDSIAFTLTKCDSLYKDPAFGAYNSPMVGSKIDTVIPVTLSVANGEIGFQSVQPITVNEPEDAPYSVSGCFKNMSSVPECIQRFNIYV
jgi:hypothetical protein